MTEEPKQPEEKIKTNEEGHLATFTVDGKEYKVVNSCKMIDIWVHKLENGKEVSQVVAHEFMMVDHKTYMIRLLTDAIMTVMRAKKRTSMVKLVAEAGFNRIRRFLNNKKRR